MAVLGPIFDSHHFDISKYNTNVDIPVKMRGRSSSYDLQFQRNENSFDFLLKKSVKNEIALGPIQKSAKKPLKWYFLMIYD